MAMKKVIIMTKPKIISLTNLKGGCGKSLTTDLVCYELAKMGKKVLTVDLDPQANTTQILGRSHKLATGKTLKIKQTMMSSISNSNLSKSIVNIIPNLDLVPSYIDFYQYPWFAISKSLKHTNNVNTLHDMVISLFDYLMKPIINNGRYDYIFYDCPPTISTYVESALLDVDYIAVILQTEEPSFDGAKEFLKYAKQFYQSHKSAHYKFLGMIAVLKKRSPIDNNVLKRAERYFGTNSLLGIINWYRRVERYSSQGISDKGTKYTDYHDIKIHNIYKKLAKSLISRVKNGGIK